MPRGVPNPDPSMYGISRLPEGKGAAWQVFLRRSRKKYSAIFGDRQHGGRDAALVAAKAFRDQVVSETESLTRRQFAQIVRSSNMSGIPGVRRIAKKPPYAYWVAATRLADGRSVSRTFSVNLLGEEIARERAIEARMQQLELVSGAQVFSPALRETEGKTKAKAENNNRKLSGSGAKPD